MRGYARVIVSVLKWALMRGYVRVIVSVLKWALMRGYARVIVCLAQTCGNAAACPCAARRSHPHNVATVVSRLRSALRR